MARNELSKDAMKIADLIYKKAAEKTNRELAASVGLSESQFGRVVGQYTDIFSAYLDRIGLAVHEKGQVNLVGQEEHKALLILARKALDEELQ